MYIRLTNGLTNKILLYRNKYCDMSNWTKYFRPHVCGGMPVTLMDTVETGKFYKRIMSTFVHVL